MVKILARLFIKDNKNYEDEKVRGAYGILCGVVGICLNICLFAIKLFAGIISKSIAITADAFNNLSDAGSSLVSILGFKLANQEPDSKHPYGHGRFEYVSGLLISVIIIIMSYELFTDAVDKILHPQDITFSPLILGILIVSILTKIYMFAYNRGIGKLINSSSMKATAMDSVSDSIATTVVLISTLVLHFTGLKVDGYSGVLVSLFVFWAGINSAKETIGPLLGQAPEKEFVDRIVEIVMLPEHKELGVLGMHDLMVHDYGPGRLFVSLHVEVPSNGDVMEFHDLIDNIEYDLRTELKCHAVIHMDPILIDDEETNKKKEVLRKVIDDMNQDFADKNRNKFRDEKIPKITFHDFRIVKGPTHTNLIFDIVLPYEFDMNDEEAADYIRKAVWYADNTCFCVVEVDRAYA